MSETIFKTYRAILKEPDEDGSLNMFIPVSTTAMDRDSEVIEPTAFKKTLPKFMKHPVLVASHDYRDLQNQIGEWTKLKITEDGIEGSPKYYVGMGNEQADWAFKLAQKGVAAFSVGFIPKEWEDGDGQKSPRRTYKEVELLEISQVIIPSNREAIQNIRSKSVDPIITGLCDEVEKEIEPDGIIESIQKPYPQEHACRLRSPDDFQADSFRRTTRDHEGKKYSIIMGRLKGETSMTEQAYRYDKDVWAVGEARAHCKSHDGSTFEAAKPEKTSQEQILDEIDYLTKLIKENGMNDKVKESLQSLTDMEIKVGAVLNKKNKDRLNQIKTLAQEVLNSAGQEEEEEKRLPEDDTLCLTKDIDTNPEQEILDQIKNIKLGG